MKISRFYQATSIVVSEDLELSTENHRHAIQVLRLKVNDTLVLFNDEGGEYLATLTHIDKRKSSVRIDSFSSVNRESPLHITLALATIKSDKMDFAIQKAVELGVSVIQPMTTNRSVIKIKRLEKKMSHWQGVIVAACEQSGRTVIPQLNEPLNFDKCLKNATGTCITMLPNASQKITDLEPDKKNLISLFVGPEGGFTDEEEKLMMQHSFQTINFGPRILRAETAVIAGITACQIQWGDI